jgi:osmotically-inducible protein OsmY
MALAAFFLCAASSTTAIAETPKANDITASFAQAGLAIEGFRAIEVGGIVVLRGRTADLVSAEKAVTVAKSLGHTRVANLIQVVEPADDDAIERLAERRLGMSRGLDGCHIQIDSDNGVVKLNGTVRYELQKDVAIQLIRNIDGVKSVQSALKK